MLVKETKKTVGRASPTRADLSGRRFGKLEVVCRSDKRGSRGARTVPLWECRCDCGNTVYKATDTLNRSPNSMCGACAADYASKQMRAAAGYVDGTQLSRIKSDKPIANNTSGARGVYRDSVTGKWRARLKFKGKLMDFGTYTKFEDAVRARKQAEEIYYGELLDSVSTE